MYPQSATFGEGVADITRARDTTEPKGGTGGGGWGGAEITRVGYASV